jgi:hypothetical protein
LNVAGEQASMQAQASIKGLDTAAKKVAAETGIVPPSEHTWRRLIVEDIVFDPSAADTVYLITNKGIYKSADRAASWSLLNVGLRMIYGVSSLAVNPSNTKHVVVGTADGIFVSTDGGCTFSKTFGDG